MGATRTAVGLIGSVLKSLMSILTGTEAEQPSDKTRSDYATAAEKEKAARSRSILERRLAHCARMTPTPKPATPDFSDVPDGSRDRV